MKTVTELSDSRLSSKYEKLLIKNGYKIGAVSDDVLIFKEDKEFTFGYTLGYESKEPRYLAFGLAAAVKSEKERGEVERYQLLQDAIANIKYIKVHFRPGIDSESDSIQFSCDFMIFRDEDFPEMVRRAVDVLSYAYGYLAGKYQNLL